MIFISHSSKDDEFVDRLRNSLTRLGHEVWVDHINIPAGVHWDEVVDQQIINSTAMILVLSPDAVESENVKVEWRAFKEQKKPLLPIKLRECRIPLLLRYINYVDFTDDAQFHNQVSKLNESLPPPANTPVAGAISGATAPIVINQKELELVKIREEVKKLRLRTQNLVGEDQMLLAISALKRSKLVDLDREKLFIGWRQSQQERSPEIDLTPLDAPKFGVSRQHAMITRIDNVLTITDLGSRNGTFINRKRLPIEKPVELENDVVLHLGAMAMQVFYNLKNGAG